MENIKAGKVPCKKCKTKDLEIVQPAPTGDGTPGPGVDPDAEVKAEAKAKADAEIEAEAKAKAELEAKAEAEATGTNGRPQPRTGGEIDAERKETSLKLATAKKDLEAANAKKRADDREEYLESELTDEELEEWEGLECRANCGNPHPPLFPEDMKRLADLRIRAEFNEQD